MFSSKGVAMLRQLRRLRRALPQRSLNTSAVLRNKRAIGATQGAASTRSLHSKARAELPVSTPAVTKRHRTQDAAERWMDNLQGDEMTHILAAGQTADSWFTGPRPYPGQCAGVLPDKSITSLALCNTQAMTRQSAQDYFDNTWALTEVLFAGLKDEDAFFCPPGHGLRHPLIFYYGHVASLYINKLRVAGVLDAPINAYYEQIFETGVDEMGWDDMNKNHMQWPTVSEVRDYRRQVYQTVSELLATTPLLADEHGTTVLQDHPLWALVMGFEHERIHFETSAVLIRELPLDLVRQPEQWRLHDSATNSEGWVAPEEGKNYPANELLDAAGGPVKIGKPDDFPSFGWDNEYGNRDVDNVEAFRASKFLITNGEFYKFVTEGGYQEERFWSTEGWGWKQHRNAKAPFWWEWDGPQGLMQFRLRTTFEEVDMPWDWPVDVNWHESKAYAAWKSEQDNTAYRLITEAEHHCIRNSRNPEDPLDIASDPVMLYSGNEMPVNLNMKHGSESPVDSHAASETGHFDVAGNVWEWCEDDLYPLEGFETHNHYTDFSTPCFDGRHQMILGGAFASTGDEASVFARFHFRPHFLQQSGFRLIDAKPGSGAALKGTSGSASSTSETVSSTTENFYESDAAIAQYLLLHYGGAKETFQDARHESEPTAALHFPKRCAEVLSDAYAKYGDAPADVLGAPPPLRALDIGCAVGGSTLELTRKFEEVIGVDFSGHFIDVARSVQYKPQEVLYYPTQESGLDYGERQAVEVDPSLDVGRASFRTGDACNLSVNALGGPFDAVLMANLICRLPDPTKCLESLSQEGGVGIVRKGGVVMLVTPFSWLDEYTPRDKWLWDESSEFGDSFEAMCEVLKPNFELVERKPFPLMIREHRRKWQYIVPDATIFKRIA